MVYLIHFESPFRHAQHYIGFTTLQIEERMKRHNDGNGAKLLRAVTAAGIPWKVVRTWPDGDQTFERQLKNRKSARRLCPVCRERNQHGNLVESR